MIDMELLACQRIRKTGKESPARRVELVSAFSTL